MKLREKVEQLASDWHEGGYDEYADALDALLSTADSEQRGLRDAFAALLRSHSWYTTREYERDTTYNNQSRGYQEEALAVRVFEETWGSDALMEALQTGGGKASLTRPAEQREVADLRRQVKEYADAHTLMDEDMADLRREVREESAARELAENEVADLRRKLEETNLENGRLLNDRKVFAQMLNESERERAASSLANAALRTALVYKPHDSYNSCRLCGQTWWDDKPPNHSPGCIAALPADSLAQEVVTDIQAVHDLCFEPKGLMQTSMTSTADADHAKAHRILDALLTRIGGKT